MTASDPLSLPALIARLEAATKGSRELDLEIGRAVFGWTDIPDDSKPTLGQYDWTRSLDAALSLVPPELGLVMGRGRIKPGELPFGAILYREDADPTEENEVAGGESHSFALALCIASLRARLTP